jgi:hypothetical protein
MRRLLAATVVALALGAGSASADVPSLGVRVAKCSTGVDPASRSAVFTAGMPAIAGTARMEMRFDLLQQRPGADGFAHVDLPKWGGWEHSSKSDVPGFIFTKRIEQLAAPADYRAVVRFRWLDSHGKALRNARRTSSTCHQPDQRPDLRVGDLTLAPDGSYVVGLSNAGHSDAGPFAISLAAGGVTGTSQVAGLAAGMSTTVAVAAGRCGPGELVTITLDPTDAVDEAHEGDNTVIRPCPVAGRR